MTSPATGRISIKQRSIEPVFAGREMAGQAILKSLSIVSQTAGELQLLPVRQVIGGDSPNRYISDNTDPVLFLANPSGLHAQFISEGGRESRITIPISFGCRHEIEVESALTGLSLDSGIFAPEKARIPRDPEPR